MADQTVRTTEIDIDSLVLSLEGEEFHKPEIAYEFSNGRTFEDQGENSSIYNP